MSDHSTMPKFEYSRITPQIYIGTNACCEFHFKKELTQKGVRADVSMEAERLDAAKGAQYFLWLPTRDHAAPTLKKLRVGAHALRELVEAGEKVYVHCRNGHGRAPTLVAAYFILMGMDADQAIATIQKKRRSIHIESVQRKRLEQFMYWCEMHRWNKHV